jgi:valyl-tRNA synthetase
LFYVFDISVAAASENNGVFTSPEIAKSFDFAAEERIYNWYFLFI